MAEDRRQLACHGVHGLALLPLPTTWGMPRRFAPSQIPGPAVRRSVTLLWSVPVAWLLVTAGTLLAGNVWAASAGMLVFGFFIAYAGVGGPRLETVAASVACPTRLASPHARREHMLRDVAHGDRQVFLLWYKRIWRCRNVDCPKRTWSEQTELAAAKASLTSRTRAWAERRVGEHADTVAATARSLGVGWHTVIGAVTEHGQPLIDDVARQADVHALGVDEHAWQRANAHRHTQFATGIVDLSPGRPARLLDVVADRSGDAYGTWLDARGPEWRARIRLAALDPFRGYLNALRYWAGNRPSAEGGECEQFDQTW